MTIKKSEGLNNKGLWGYKPWGKIGRIKNKGL